jgi:hypothetical protein
VVSIAREAGLAVHEQNLPREILYAADELFLTGTASEVTPVRSVDHIAVGQRQARPGHAAAPAALPRRGARRRPRHARVAHLRARRARGRPAGVVARTAERPARAGRAAVALLLAAAAAPAAAQQPAQASAPLAPTRFRVEEATIADVRAALRERRLTCRELVTAYLRRIEAYDRNGPGLNAVVVVNPDALAVADSLDARGGSAAPGPAALRARAREGQLRDRRPRDHRGLALARGLPPGARRLPGAAAARGRARWCSPRRTWRSSRSRRTRP